jgi:hypothetical protein
VRLRAAALLALLLAGACTSTTLGGGGAGKSGTGGTGASSGATGAGGIPVSGSGGGFGTGGSNTGGGSGVVRDGAVDLFGDATAGVDCMADPTSCGVGEYCGLVELNGNYQVHRCFSNAGCQTCGCLAKALADYYEATYSVTSFSASCSCPAGADAAASATSVVSCSSP